MKSYSLLLLSAIALTSSYAQEEESMDTLLDTFVHNSDLSKKTKLENAGNVTIITREELERMQARNLRDVLKSVPTINYKENRWATPDPGYIVQYLPFNSNSVRIYIDNQEVSTALYGSGLFHIGNIDIGFVDHIEVYTLNPSFEHSTEPARHLIKLYSKTAQRDKGGKVALSAGSRGFNQESFQYADIVDDISYFTYISRMDDQRKEHKSSFDTPLSRDQERYFFFSTISTDAHQVQVQAIKNDKDMFIGSGTAGISEVAKNDTEYLHVGYNYNAVENLKLGLVWESSTLKNHYKNDYEDLKVDNGEQILTADVQYKWDGFENNEFIVGTKYRYKHFTIDYMERDGEVMPEVAFDTQTIASFYMENHYAISENWLLTLGGQISKVHNNAEVEDQNVWLSRTGVIYSDENWIAKTFLHRSEFLIEPYLYTTVGYKVQPSIEPEEVTNITQEIQYTKDSDKLRMVFGYSELDNYVELGSGDRVINLDITQSLLFAYMEYAHQFDTRNSLSSNFSVTQYRDFNNLDSRFNEYKAMVRLLNRFGDFDIFNELIYNYNTVFEEKYYDYSAGVTYQYSDALKFSIKGENIFDRAREDYYPMGRYDVSTGDWEHLGILQFSPIDQKVYLTIEYLF